jgi:hypothetical protein
MQSDTRNPRCSAACKGAYIACRSTQNYGHHVHMYFMEACKMRTNTQADLRIPHFKLLHAAVHSEIRRFPCVFVRIL